jgi:hypothetical protein
MPRTPEYEGKMTHRTFSIPAHLDEWLRSRKQGASDWIREQIERQMKAENASVRIKDNIKALMEQAKQDLEAIEQKEQEETKKGEIVAMDMEKQTEFNKVRGEIDYLKSLGEDTRKMYNLLYIYYKGKKKGFNPLHDLEDAKTILEAFKVEMAEEEARIKTEMENAKKEADKVLGASKPKED